MSSTTRLPEVRGRVRGRRVLHGRGTLSERETQPRAAGAGGRAAGVPSCRRAPWGLPQPGHQAWLPLSPTEPPAPEVSRLEAVQRDRGQEGRGREVSRRGRLWGRQPRLGDRAGAFTVMDMGGGRAQMWNKGKVSENTPGFQGTWSRHPSNRVSPGFGFGCGKQGCFGPWRAVCKVSPQPRTRPDTCSCSHRPSGQRSPAGCLGMENRLRGAGGHA